MDKKELKKYGLTELESRFEELPPEYLESRPGFKESAAKTAAYMKSLLEKGSVPSPKK